MGIVIDIVVVAKVGAVLAIVGKAVNLATNIAFDRCRGLFPTPGYNNNVLAPQVCWATSSVLVGVSSTSIVASGDERQLIIRGLSELVISSNLGGKIGFSVVKLLMESTFVRIIVLNV